MQYIDTRNRLDRRVLRLVCSIYTFAGFAIGVIFGLVNGLFILAALVLLGIWTAHKWEVRHGSA